MWHSGTARAAAGRGPAGCARACALRPADGPSVLPPCGVRPEWQTLGQPSNVSCALAPRVPLLAVCAEDVATALEDLDFGELVPPLRAALEGALLLPV